MKDWVVVDVFAWHIDYAAVVEAQISVNYTIYNLIIWHKLIVIAQTSSGRSFTMIQTMTYYDLMLCQMVSNLDYDIVSSNGIY